MKVIAPSVELIMPMSGMDMLKAIEAAGRTCYKSEGKIKKDSEVEFIKSIMKRNHGAVLEHASFTARFICDRGVSHEIVRHRLASYCQESTRYCNYSQDKFGGEITVIRPCFLIEDTQAWAAWESAMKNAEYSYFRLLDIGLTAQQARSVLPNSLKTEVVMTANIREWQHFFTLRCAQAAHPQMREVACMLLDKVRKEIPILFDNIQV